MDSIFDTTKPMNLHALKEELCGEQMTGARSTMARLLASELFLDGRFHEAAEVVAATIGWFYETCGAYRRDVVFCEESSTGSKKDWLAHAPSKPNAGSEKKNVSLVRSLQELLPPSWTVVMVCTVPADESEYFLMENQLNSLQQNNRSGVGTALVVRMNNTGPAVLMPVRKPLDFNCPKHAVIPVDPWVDSVHCEHCWNGYKELSEVIGLLKESTSKNKDDNTPSCKDWVRRAQDKTSALLNTMKWAWLQDGGAALLRGVPLSDGNTNEYRALHEAVSVKFKALWKNLSPKVGICDEATFCIAHFLIELGCISRPARDDGLVTSIRDVLLSYHCDSFNDQECYNLAKKIEDGIRPTEWKEAAFVREKGFKVDRGPVILVLDKDYVALPWESLCDLNGRPVSRVPSVTYLIEELKKRRASAASAEFIRGPRLQREKLFYVLNPGKDLPKTMERLKSVVTHVPGWQGTIGEEPTSERLVEALKANDIYAYFGHGDGRQYLRAETLDKLSSRALVMLFGCGSCDIQPESQIMEPTGIAYSYLQVGCAGVMGMLYAVTDRDCDDMAKYVMKEFLGAGEGVTQPKPDLDFAQVVADCRRVCSRTYNAHAPVFFGLPDVKLANKK